MKQQQGEQWTVFHGECLERWELEPRLSRSVKTGIINAHEIFRKDHRESFGHFGG